MLGVVFILKTIIFQLFFYILSETWGGDLRPVCELHGSCTPATVSPHGKFKRVIVKGGGHT